MTGNAGAKFTVGVFELNAGGSRKAAETSTYSGLLPTALMIDLIGRARHRLIRMSPSVPAKLRQQCADAANRRMWVIAESTWQVQGGDQLALRSATVSADAEHTAPELVFEVPAREDELTISGRGRLRPGRRINAGIFAQTEGWDPEAGRFTAIAHAVFARLGDPKFEWQGAELLSTGDNSNGDF